MMRIVVAARAGREVQSGVLRLAIHTGNVAFSAKNLLMRPGQRVARRRMVKAMLIELCVLPAHHVMAARAVSAELSLVLVLMAARALRLQPHEGVVQILLLQQRPFRLRNILRLVATAAVRYLRMLALQGITRLAVVKPLRRRLPVQHLEAFAVVVRVALHAARVLRAGVRKC